MVCNYTCTCCVWEKYIKTEFRWKLILNLCDLWTSVRSFHRPRFLQHLRILPSIWPINELFSSTTFCVFRYSSQDCRLSKLVIIKRTQFLRRVNFFEYVHVLFIRENILSTAVFNPGHDKSKFDDFQYHTKSVFFSERFKNHLLFYCLTDVTRNSNDEKFVRNYYFFEKCKIIDLSFI